MSLYPTEDWDVALSLREMGSTQVGGMRRASPHREQDEQSTASREGVNSTMEQEEGSA
jgi:hypothetical protein